MLRQNLVTLLTGRSLVPSLCFPVPSPVHIITSEIQVFACKDRRESYRIRSDACKCHFDAVSRRVVPVVDSCRHKEVEVEVGRDLEIWVQEKAGSPVGVGKRPAAIENPSKVGGRVETFVVF